MSLLECVRGLLLAEPLVTALVASRIYPDHAPQQAPFPRVVTTLVSSQPTNSLQGFTSGLEESRVQIDAYSRTSPERDALAGYIGAAFEARLGLFSSIREQTRNMFLDEPLEIFRASIDFKIFAPRTLAALSGPPSIWVTAGPKGDQGPAGPAGPLARAWEVLTDPVAAGDAHALPGGLSYTASGDGAGLAVYVEGLLRQLGTDSSNGYYGQTDATHVTFFADQPAGRYIEYWKFA